MLLLGVVYLSIPYSFPHFLLADQLGGGGGGPLCHPSYASAFDNFEHIA